MLPRSANARRAAAPRKHSTHPAVRASRPTRASDASATFPRVAAHSQNTLTQVDFVRLFTVPDSEDDEEEEALDNDQDDWESPQPKKKRKTATKSRAPSGTIGESQRTLTQMPEFFLRDSEDDGEDDDDGDDGEEQMPLHFNGRVRAERGAAEGGPAQDQAGTDPPEDEHNPFMRPIEMVPSSQRSQDEMLNIHSTAMQQQDVDPDRTDDNTAGRMPRQPDVPDVDAHATETIVQIHRDPEAQSPSTPAKPIRREIPSSQSPACTPLTLSRTPSQNTPSQRFPLGELSVGQVTKRDEQVRNTPTKGKKRVSSGPLTAEEQEDLENLEPDEPLMIKATPTKTSPLRNQIQADTPFEPSEVADVRRRYNTSPSPSPRRIHSLGSSHIRVPLQERAGCGNAAEDYSQDAFSPTKRRASGSTPGTSFSLRSPGAQAKTSPLVRTLFKPPSQPGLRSSPLNRASAASQASPSSQRHASKPAMRRSESFHTAPESGSSQMPLARFDFESMPPPFGLDSEAGSNLELLTMSQLLAEDED